MRACRRSVNTTGSRRTAPAATRIIQSFSPGVVRLRNRWARVLTHIMHDVSAATADTPLCVVSLASWRFCHEPSVESNMGADLEPFSRVSMHASTGRRGPPDRPCRTSGRTDTLAPAWLWCPVPLGVAGSCPELPGSRQSADPSLVEARLEPGLLPALPVWSGRCHRYYEPLRLPARVHPDDGLPFVVLILTNIR